MFLQKNAKKVFWVDKSVNCIFNKKMIDRKKWYGYDGYK